MKQIFVVLVALFTSSFAMVQQPIQRIDYPTVEWAQSVLNRIHLLSQGMSNEVLLCGLGHTQSDTIFVDDVYMPDQVSTSVTVTGKQACPSNTMLVWHLHPWSGPDSSEGLTSPTQLCAMSTTDMISTLLNKRDVSAISVGYDNRTYLCWWNRKQILSALDSSHAELESISGQRMIYWLPQ